MKIIYMTGNQWRDRVLRAELDRAAGDAAPRAGRRGLPAGKGNVVDLAAWRAENLTEMDGPEDGRVSALGQYAGRELVRRRQRRSTAALDRAELAATLAVAAAFAALMLRILLF